MSFAALSSCKTNKAKAPLYPITKSATGDSAMVVSAHPLATQVGIDILRKGGNAVDAAIAVQFALAVVYPQAGNIGGGGFMVYRGKDGEVATLDYREKAPSLANKDMYLDSLGNPIVDKSQYGALAAGVPGTVDGMVAAYEKYSKLKDWKTLLQPAIDLADKGYLITAREADNLNEEQANFVKYNRFETAFHKPKWAEGERLTQAELGKTLSQVRDSMRAGFYSGSVGRYIVDEMKASGGLISSADLTNYKSVWRKPLVSQYRNHTIIGMPPPSSGGICLQQLLEMVEPYDLKSMGFQSAAHIHLVAEAERRVYADRAQHLGDADFYKVPKNGLLDSTYLIGRMKDFDPRKASISDSISYGILESDETTHFSIIDYEGNAVSITTTLNGSYGACTVVKGAGFILNNEMDDFSVKPGAPNMYGLVGSEANKIEPNKRMLSSMTPTIIVKDGKVKMVVGTPGGSTIITSVFQTITNVLDFGMSIDQAVQSPRFHHQWKPDQIFHESDAISESERKNLEAIGHKLKDRGAIGRVEAILVDKGQITGAADRRGDDDAKGY
jgi:gamma-glutamyltranspeptidase / glutathione hydrolase